MSSLARRFIKNLLTHGVIFGLKSKKLTGINDSTHLFTGTLDIQAPDKITFPSEVPSFVTENRYFRITDGGGANEGLLFRVASVDGDTITVNTGTSSVIDFLGTATLDARFAIVHDDQTISKLSTKGSTIFNMGNHTGTGLEDCSNIATAAADHYHTLIPNSPCFDFVIADWVDQGDTYFIDVIHNLNTSCPSVHVFESGQEVWTHGIIIVDSNTVRIKVTNAGSDCRFSGTGVISGH